MTYASRHRRRVRIDVAGIVAERGVDDLRAAVGDVGPRIGHVILHAALRDLRRVDVGEVIDRENLSIEGDAMHQAVVLLCGGDARDGMAMRIRVDRCAGLRLIECDRLRIRTDTRRVVVDFVGGAELEIEIHDADDHAGARVSERVSLCRVHRVESAHAIIFRRAEAVRRGCLWRRRLRERPRRLDLRHAAAAAPAAAQQRDRDRGSSKRRSQSHASSMRNGKTAAPPEAGRCGAVPRSPRSERSPY